jgi:hypothetical protein
MHPLRSKVVVTLFALAIVGTPARAIPVADAGTWAGLATINSTLIAGFTTMTTAIAAAAAPIALQLHAIGTALGATSSAAQQTGIETAKIQVEAADKREVESSIITARTQMNVTNPCSIGAMSGVANEVISGTSGIASTIGRNGSAPALDGGGTAPIGSANGKVSASGGRTQMNRAINAAMGKAPSTAPEVTAMMAASAGCSNFAGDNQQRKQDCIAAGLDVSGSSQYKDADIRAQTLFDGPQKAGSATKKLSVDMTPGSDEYIAMHAFLRNMGTPTGLRSLGAGELNTPAGRKYLGIKDTYDARMSIAEWPATQQMANVAKTPKTIPALKDMIADDAFVRKYLDKVPDWQTKGVSSDELLNIDVERRYLNVTWHATLQGMQSVEEIAREQARISAQQSMFLWQQLQTQRQTNMLLGSILASLNRSEMGTELKAAHTAAAR